MKMYEDGFLEKIKHDRYASFDEGIFADFENGEGSLNV